MKIEIGYGGSPRLLYLVMCQDKEALNIERGRGGIRETLEGHGLLVAMVQHLWMVAKSVQRAPRNELPWLKPQLLLVCTGESYHSKVSERWCIISSIRSISSECSFMFNQNDGRSIYLAREPPFESKSHSDGLPTIPIFRGCDSYFSNGISSTSTLGPRPGSIASSSELGDEPRGRCLSWVLGVS